MTDPIKRKYKKNFLTQVIYQVTYDHTDSVNDSSMKAFKKLLGEKYAVLETVKQQGIIIQNDGSDIKTEKEDKFLWQIESAEKDHVFMVNQSSFSITFNTYTNFRKYLEVVTKGQKAFAKIFEDVKQFNRLGLRYVNQIRPNELEFTWSDYFDDHLVDSFGFVEDALIRRSMHSLVIEHDKETLITMNYGVYNQFFPAPILENEFIIDIDAYTPNAIERSDQERLLEKFNRSIAIYYERSIKDKLRKEMEEIDG